MSKLVYKVTGQPRNIVECFEYNRQFFIDMSNLSEFDEGVVIEISVWNRLSTPGDYSEPPVYDISHRQEIENMFVGNNVTVIYNILDYDAYVNHYIDKIYRHVGNYLSDRDGAVTKHAIYNKYTAVISKILCNNAHVSSDDYVMFTRSDILIRREQFKQIVQIHMENMLLPETSCSMYVGSMKTSVSECAITPCDDFMLCLTGDAYNKTWGMAGLDINIYETILSHAKLEIASCLEYSDPLTRYYLTDMHSINQSIFSSPYIHDNFYQDIRNDKIRPMLFADNKLKQSNNILRWTDNPFEYINS